MRLKKATALATAGIMAVSLVGCGSSSSKPETTAAATTAAATEAEKKEETPAETTAAAENKTEAKGIRVGFTNSYNGNS